MAIYNPQEFFPLLSASGHPIGKATRERCHNGSKLLHPVVHLHVISSKGELLLQKRAAHKDIQPGKWDTAVGGHVDFGENTQQALRREALEELGIVNYQTEHVCHYIYESDREKEWVDCFICHYDGPFHIAKDEMDEVRFWTLSEIRSALGQSILTPNFEQEFKRIQLENKLI